MIPKTLVKLGVVESIQTDNGEYIHTFKWPTRGKNKRVLFTNARGNRLFIAVVKQKKITQKMTDKSRSAIRACENTFDTWNDGPANTIECLVVNEKPLKKFGKIKNILYHSDKWGKQDRYIHEFGRNVIVSMDDTDEPTLMEIKGGTLRVTDRGIEG